MLSNRLELSERKSSNKQHRFAVLSWKFFWFAIYVWRNAQKQKQNTLTGKLQNKQEQATNSRFLPFSHLFFDEIAWFCADFNGFCLRHVHNIRI